MNVTFKLMRRSGDKAYILSEITDYDEGLPVVLTASTENGSRIPSDVFPFVNQTDLLAMEHALFDTALAVRDDVLAGQHAKNSPAVRFFVVVLPWFNVKRWVLEFRAINAEGKTQSFCVNSLDVDAFRWRSRLDIRRGMFQSEALEQMSKSFVHDRIQISFLRAIEEDKKVLVSAALDMPYHSESSIEFDFLDGCGRPIDLDFDVIEDSVTHGEDFGSLERRHLELSVALPKSSSEICVCATDTVGTIAPGFAMLGQKSLAELLEEFGKQTCTAYSDPHYDQWYQEHQRADLPTLFEQVSVRFEHEPLISVVCVLEDAQHHHIHDVMNALLTQSYGKWELILVNVTGGETPATSLLEVFQDDRMYLVDVDPNLSRTEKINTAIYAAEGEYVGCLSTHDLIAPNALFECVRTINAFPTCDVIYCDSDTVDVQGYHSHPVLRPDYSPEFLRSFNYFGSFVIYSEQLLEKIGLLDPAFEGALTYDLNLRASEQARKVCHIPRVICHRRFASEVKPDQAHIDRDQETGRKALVAHCKRTGMSGEVLSLDPPFRYRIRHVLLETPKVTIVINSENNADQIQRCVKNIYQQLNYANFAVVVVDTGSTVEDVERCYAHLAERFATFSTLQWTGEFNHARLANFAVSQIESDFYFFMTDDTRILTPDAIQIMLGYFQDERVGIIGPQKLFLDGTIEHGGLAVGGQHIITPLSRFMLAGWRGYLDRCVVSHNVSAVSGDCLLVSRKVFDQVGGFTEEFSIAYSDVDFCLKALELGFYTVYTPYVTLTHFRSVNRLRNYSQAFLTKRKREAALLQYLWPVYFVKGDGFYSPSFDPNSPYFALRED